MIIEGLECRRRMNKRVQSTMDSDRPLISVCIISIAIIIIIIIIITNSSSRKYYEKRMRKDEKGPDEEDCDT